MKSDYKSELTDEDCRIIVDHLLTDKHRKLVISDLVKFHKTMKSEGSWQAGHYTFRVRIEKGLVTNRPNTRVEKTWQAGRYHKRQRNYF